MIDSGDKNLFKEFMSMENKKIRIDNGDYIPTIGKGTIVIKTCGDT